MVVAAPVEGTYNISFISFISSVCAVQVNGEGGVRGEGGIFATISLWLPNSYYSYLNLLF